MDYINFLTKRGGICMDKPGQDMQDRKRHDAQDRFSEITKAILKVLLWCNQYARVRFCWIDLSKCSRNCAQWQWIRSFCRAWIWSRFSTEKDWDIYSRSHCRKASNYRVKKLRTSYWRTPSAADQLFSSDEFVGWFISKFWKTKVGIQKSTPSCSSCRLRSCKSCSFLKIKIDSFQNSGMFTSHLIWQRHHKNGLHKFFNQRAHKERRTWLKNYKLAAN